MTLFNKIRRQLKHSNIVVVYSLTVVAVLYVLISISLKGREQPRIQNVKVSFNENLQPERITEKRKKEDELNPKPSEDEAFLRFLREREAEKIQPPQSLPCNPKSIPSKHDVFKEDVSCIPHKSTQQACDYASQLYWNDESLKTCGRENIRQKVEICTFTEVTEHTHIRYVYKCSFKDCHRFHKFQVSVLKFDTDEHQMTEYQSYNDEKKLEHDLPLITQQTFKEGHNFLFLECGRFIEKVSQPLISQLFIIPPLYKENKQVKRLYKTNRKKQPKININLMLLDSTARSHFYRSLPNTLKALTNVNQNTQSEALDFELLQALEGHTAENLHALFTGTLFPKHFTGTDRENSPVGIGKLLKYYKENGYNTLYHDDLCFDEWWGLRLDLGGPQTWMEFQNLLKQNHIDQTGLTFASCRILNSNNVTNPFNGPEGPLCFNGKFHDSYHLEFLQMYHKHASRQNNALFSYTELNVGHDYTGKRIQSIDNDLAKFVSKISEVENTLTILFADHGNTYTQYTHGIMEGRFEQYHPAMFFIIPEKIQKQLGIKIMTNLRQNTKKIVTLIDIHRSLKTVPVKIKPRGIFGSISNNRSCDDLDLRLPNLCVCEGWDAETLNDTSQLGVLDFAVGEINNKIVKYQEHIRASGYIPSCQRLVTTSFYNILERNKNGRLVTSLTFTVNSGYGAPQNKDVFYVQLQSTIHPENESRNMSILSFDRLSRYGPYSVCADKGIDLRLCVCNMKKSVTNFKNIKELILHDLTTHPQLFFTDIELKHVTKISPCLYYRILSYPEISEDQEEPDNIYSASFEVANICAKDLQVSFHVTYDNMKMSQRNLLPKTISPYSVVYIASIIRTVPYWSSKIEKVTFNIEKDFPPSLENELKIN